MRHGTGPLIQKAFAQFPDTKFFLADPSPQMLAVAKQKLVQTQKVTFFEPSPTQKLTLTTEKFDAITAIQCHHYLSWQEREKATATCYNLLAPNGVYTTFENIRPLTKEGITIGLEKWRQFQLSRGREPKAMESHIQRFGTEYFPITIEDHLKVLREAGFGVVEVLWTAYMKAGFYCLK
jgi:tRNA (cmo5U34)-methyltransferase